MQKNYIIKFIISHKIKQQIKLIFLLVTIIPIFGIGIYSIAVAKGQMQMHYETQVNSDNLRIKSTLFDITTSILNYSENIINSFKYNLLFSSTDFQSQKDDYNQLSELMSEYHNNNAAIFSITMYTNNPNIPKNDHVIPVSNFNSQDWYTDTIDTKWDSWENVIYKDSFNNSTPTLTLVRKMRLTNPNYSAFVVIKLSSNYIKNRLQNTDYFILCSVNNSSIFFSSDRSWTQKKIPFPESIHINSNFISYTGGMDIDGENTLTNISTFLPYKTNDSFYISVSDFSAYENINKITRTYVIILALATIFPIAIIFIFSSYFSSRIEILRDAMHQARLGDYNIIDHFKGDDELTDTFRDLQATVNHIHKTEGQYYQTKIKEQQLINEQQQMEFQMLSSQINPHFLYNTLETIRMQALARGNRDVATSVKFLGQSMRYVLENTGTDSTTLAKEIDHVKVYLAIQQLRFADRVSYDVQIDPSIDLDNHKILPLLLQPIVENAIIHGLEGKNDGGFISIQIFLRDEDTLQIKITDNGDGISEAQLEQMMYQIRNGSYKNSSGSIGLSNINQRIRLLYGPDYGLSIESTLQTGTTVTLTLPANYITR